MEIRNNTTSYQSRPTFQANVEPGLAKELEAKAKKISPALLEKVKNQIKLVESWEDETYEIGFTKNKQKLALFRSNLSEELPPNGSILSTFLNLRKSHITNAKKKIEQTVFNKKLDLIVKALKDNSFAKRIAGKPNPTDEELAAAIDKLSEDEITNLRFGLDSKPVENAKLLDFVV